jgi:hypothetical protein
MLFEDACGQITLRIARQAGLLAGEDPDRSGPRPIAPAIALACRLRSPSAGKSVRPPFFYSSFATLPMPTPKFLTAIKCVTIIAFLITLSTTYYLRSEVLKLNRLRFSSDNLRAEETLRALKESYPVRVAEHAVQSENYQLEMEHYEEMLALYRSNYEEYVKRLKDEFRPPQLPQKPVKPNSPELSDQLATINAEFRLQQFRYFDSTSRLNFLCGLSALTLVGGLLSLIMFEQGNQRVLYLAILVLSFVFMIGPSFHSIMSAIVGFLEAPSVF